MGASSERRWLLTVVRDAEPFGDAVGVGPQFGESLLDRIEREVELRHRVRRRTCRAGEQAPPTVRPNVAEDRAMVSISADFSLEAPTVTVAQSGPGRADGLVPAATGEPESATVGGPAGSPDRVVR